MILEINLANNNPPIIRAARSEWRVAWCENEFRVRLHPSEFTNLVQIKKASDLWLFNSDSKKSINCDILVQIGEGFIIKKASSDPKIRIKIYYY